MAAVGNGRGERDGDRVKLSDGVQRVPVLRNPSVGSDEFRSEACRGSFVSRSSMTGPGRYKECKQVV